MGDTGLNKVTEFGHACDISTASKFSAVAEMPAASDIEYYTNFDRTGHYTCDQRLEFVVKFELKEDASGNSITYKPNGRTLYTSLDEIINDFESSYVGGVDLRTGVGMTIVAGSEAAGSKTVTYSKIIRADDEITQDDMNVIHGIFTAADNQNSTTTLYQGVEGDVYVGTHSNNANDTDWSDELSFRAWTERFINDVSYDINWDVSYNGDWVKFVDNDNDGAAEYAFKTHYNLEEALYTYKNRDDNVVMEFNTFDDENYAVRYLGDYTPAVGDKVLAAWIDNQCLVEPATSENVTVSSYSWRNDEITTDKGTYGQSGITNSTDMLELINTMDDKVEYVVYFDHFGYVRAYELPGGTKYALVTEMYYTNNQQGNLVDNWPMIAELTTLDDEGKTISDEYNVVSGAGVFTANQPWLRVANAVATYNYNNWLQPAIAHLGVDYNNNSNDYRAHKGTPQFTAGSSSSDDIISPNAYATFWDANRQLVRSIAANGMNGLEEFNYGAQNFTLNATKGYTWNQPANASFTNVAVVNINDKEAALTGAAKLSLGKDGKVVLTANNEPVYARDYIQLAIDDIVADAVRYPIYDAGNVTLPAGTVVDYKDYNNNWVNAVRDTQYFIAYNGGVYAFEYFENFPGLTNKDNKIHAAYAVARNTNSDLNGKPYWVADVIVYEVYDLADNLNQTSVSLAFYTPTRTSGNVQEINTLNSKYGPEVTLIPGERAWNSTAGQWGAEWEDYGFYALYNDTEAVDNVMTAKDIDRIGAKDGLNFVKNYGKNNIHAGVIVREAYIDKGGNYIDVDMGGGKITSIEITNKIYSITTKNAQSGYQYDYNVATLLRYENEANSQIRKGDMVIWVGGAKTDGTKCATNFVVDLGSTANTAPVYAGSAILEDTPSWLVSFTRDAAGNKVPNAYTSAAYADGEWQKIMNEQYTGAPAEYDYTVTVNCMDGTSVVKTLTYPVNKNGSVLIKTSDITLPGYTLGVVTNVTTGAVVNTSTVDSVAGYLITGIDKDMTVTAAQTKATLTLALTSATGTIALKVNDTAVAPAPTTGVTTNVVVGDKFEYTVSGLDNVTNSYTLTSTPVDFADDVTVAWNADNDTVTIKGTMGGDNVALTLTAAARATTEINVGNVSGTTVTFTVDDPLTGTTLADGGDVYQGTDVTFTVTGLAANTSIDKVTYTVGAGAPVEAEVVDAATGEYKIPGTAVANMPITINVSVISTAPYTITFANNATGDVFMADVASPSAGDWKAVPASLKVAHDFTGTISIQAMAPVTVTAGSASATVSTPTDYQNYTISNITGDVTITIADTGAATGLSATVAADGQVTFTGGGAAGSTTFMTYLTTGTTAVTPSAKVGMTVAEAEAALSTDTGETVTLSAVGAPGLTLPNIANTHYLVIVEVNANNRVVKAGAVEVTGIT